MKPISLFFLSFFLILSSCATTQWDAAESALKRDSALLSISVGYFHSTVTIENWEEKHEEKSKVQK